MAISTAGSRVFISDRPVTDETYLSKSDLADVDWIVIEGVTQAPDAGVTFELQESQDMGTGVTTYGKGALSFPSQTLVYEVKKGDPGQEALKRAVMRRCGRYALRVESGPEGCGAESTVTISNGSDATVTWAAHSLQDDTPVQFSTTGELPAPLRPYKMYYVTDANAGTFKLAETPGGAPIDTTSEGSGVHEALAVPSGITTMFLAMIHERVNDSSDANLRRSYTIQQTSLAIEV